MKIDVISSGILSLDLALGVGGYPKGRIVEIYGPESSGKTTFALQAIAAAQKAGGKVAFIDAEHALDPSYAEALGVDIDNLKPVNDNLGHYYGDNVIIRVANYLAQSMPHSSIYRIGGDEFIVITEKDYEEEARKIERVVLFVDDVSDKYDVTFSLGKSFYDAKKDRTISEVIKMCDDIMYSNKKIYKDSLRDSNIGGRL